MAINDVFIEVDCDECGYVERIGLTPLADRGSWDERNVIPELKRLRWLVNGESTICPECAEDDHDCEADDD